MGESGEGEEGRSDEAAYAGEEGAVVEGGREG